MASLTNIMANQSANHPAVVRLHHRQHHQVNVNVVRQDRRGDDVWTKTEEVNFAELQRIGQMDRLEAIRLFQRCRGDMNRARQIAAGKFLGDRVQAKLAMARAAKKGQGTLIG